MVDYIIWLLAGVAAGVPVYAAVSQLGRERAQDAWTLLLVLIAAIYVGPVIGTGQGTGYVEIGFAFLLLILCANLIYRSKSIS